ncbi:MAG: STAS-like domain-containing protein [Fusobacterium sp.]|uniref:STAS-like domain-containing protein n=1 Tax=Fusobacterium sp. TaxID=68766 RepID=UPI00399427A4
MKYNLATEYTDIPGGRYRKNGKFSGEEFRDDILHNLIENCIRNKEKLIINLDDVYGFPPSFLEETFGGLIREYNYTESQLKEVLDFIANDEPSLIDKIFNYIQEAQKNKRG